MIDTARRLVGALGAIVFCVTIGDGLDRAGVTPDNDGDMATRGVIAGLAAAAVVVAAIKDDR